MALDSEETMRLARERLRETEDRLAKVRKEVEESRVSVRSTDNAITVVVDGRGELVSIALNGAKWRHMAPAELGDALVKTINKARADSRAELMRAYRDEMPKPLLPGAADGRVNLEEMLNRMLGRGAAS
ncbi:MAG TPA: YbaB/EbfC family nucleoid-associated protein [Trebonia sp.]